MRTELESLTGFDRHVAAGVPLSRCVLKDLDLRGREPVLEAADLTGTLFLGCLLTPASLSLAQAAPAIVFPPVDGIPFDPYRATLYSVEDLYRGFSGKGDDGYADTVDARIDAWSRSCDQSDVLNTLAQRLHDHAITEAIAALVGGERVVGVMGGHEVRRDEPAYRAVAGIGRALQRAGLLVATGGGPGAMEAANLGAFCGPHPDDVLDDAIADLSAAPGYSDRSRWLAAGLATRSRWVAGSGRSLGIPTWHFGHEPPTPFASHIAKYFENSVREDGLLTIAKAGVIYTPGASGTAQELFQDGSQNIYSSAGRASAMVLFDKHYWNEVIAVERPLRQLAAGTQMEGLITVTDDPAEAVQAILDT